MGGKTKNICFQLTNNLEDFFCWEKYFLGKQKNLFFFEKKLFPFCLLFCFFQKKSKHKKVGPKKIIKKKKEKNIFFRLKTKFFVSKKNIFLKKKRVSKLSVSENGHFWLCPHIRLSSRTPPPYGIFNTYWVLPCLKS